MPGLYGNVGNTTVSGGNTTSLYSTGTSVTVSNNINVNDINASGNLFVAGTGTFGGNVTAPNFIGNLTGNVSGNISGNVVAPGSNTQVIYNDNGQLGGDSDFTWNESTNVLTVNGNVTATGNIAGNYILGNGSQLTGLPATYGNANVADFLDSFGSNAIVTTGNVTAGYFIGDGSQLTGLPASYGNANVAAFLPTYTGNLAGGNLDITNNAQIDGNLTVDGTIFGTFSGNISGNLVVPGANTQVLYNNAGNAGASANFTFNDATNVMTVNGTANVSVLNATGNITANSLTTSSDARVNGNLLTNVVRYGTASNDLSLDAQPGAGVLRMGTTAMGMANVEINAGRINMYHNGGSANTIANITGTLNVTGNVTGANIIGNGQYLTNLPGANVTGTVANATYATNAGSATTATHATTANTVTDAAQGNITSVGTLTGLTVGGDQNITGNLIVGQNLTVNGNTIQVNITELNVQDPIIGLGRGENNAPLTSNDGKDRGEQLWYYAGSEKSAFTGYDNSAGNLILATDVAIANEIVTVNAWGTTEVGNLYAQGNVTGGNVIGTFLYGDGSNITGVVAGSASTRIEVKNTSGGALTKGTPVYATGVVGASTIVEIAASRADTASTMPCLGLLAQDLANNGQGYAISVGTLTSTNTNGFTTGQELYVAAAGGLTASRPTGTNIVQTLGIVGRVNSVNGSIEVNIWNVNSLPNLGNGNVWIGNATGYPTEQVAYGNANVAAYLPTYTGNISGGNISITGVYTGNGSGLSSLTGANVTGTVANATYATSAGTADSATTAGTVTGNAQANITSVGTLTTLTVSGNIGTGGILTDNYYYANGTPISFGGTYGNANVADYLPTYTGNIRAVTGSIAVANTVANLAIGPSAGNLVVQGNLHVAGGFIRSTATDGVIFGTITGTGNLYTSAATVNIGGTGSTTNIRGAAAVTGNVTGANLNTAGRVVATGTVTAGAVTYANTDGTNGQVLTTYGNGITYWSSTGTSAYGNANVASYLASGLLGTDVITGANVIAYGNITAPTGNIIANKGLYVTDGNAEFSKELFVAGNIWANASNIQCQVLKLDGPNGDIIGTSGANINLSGTATFSGNIRTTSGSFVGDGSGLTNIPYGNVVGAYGNANVSNFLANGFGSNTITTTGNITVGNLNATQSVVVSGAAGNITGANYVNANFFVGNGSLLTGIVASSANTANTANTAITVTGNAQANITSVGTLTSLAVSGNANIDGNINMVGQIYDTSGVFQVNAVGNIVLVPTGTTNIQGNANVIGGQLTTGAVTYANVDGTNGQVLTTYGNGVTYFSTVSGGGGTPGGSDTQIQFNDGGSFAGNAAMTFDKTTGNIQQGNLRIVTNNAGQNPILTSTNSYSSTTRPNPGRIGVGSGYGNDWTTTYDTQNRWRNARLAVVDRVLGSAVGNTAFSSAVNYFETASEFYAVNDSGTRITDNTAFGAGRFGLNLWGPNAFGNTGGSHLVASYNALGSLVNIGNTTVGNANVIAAVGTSGGVQVNAGSVANTAVSVLGTAVNLGTMGTWVGMGVNSTSGSTQTAPTNVYLFHNPGAGNTAVTNASYLIADPVRAATNYYFLRNDDNAAQCALGSVRYYHEFRSSVASSGNVTLTVLRGNNTGSMTFYANPTGTLTIDGLANIVVTASDSVNTDQQVSTVKLIIEQGASPQTVNLPTGAAYRYVSGANSVPVTANSTSIVTWVCYQGSGATTIYNGRVETYV